MTKKIKAFAAVAICGMMFGGLFGGCNMQRILSSLVDHTVFNLVEPFLPNLTETFLDTGE